MFRRSLLFLTLIGAAVAIPYVSTSSLKLPDFLKGKKDAKQDATGMPGTTTNLPASGMTSPYSPSGAIPGMPYQPNTVLEGPPVRDLAEVIRFDVTTSWVLSRWSRVSTAPGEADLRGYRVPLVTGTRPDDLAGSLTYFFNKNHQVAQVSFHGTTGNPGRLVALATQRYGLVRDPKAEPGSQLYSIKWNGKTQSELDIRPAAVMRTDSPHSTYSVTMVIRNSAAK